MPLPAATSRQCPAGGGISWSHPQARGYDAPMPSRRVLIPFLCALVSFPLVGGAMASGSADLAWREAERARRELQRQQRIMECQNRVAARQQSYASSADFLRARQACAATR